MARSFFLLAVVLALGIIVKAIPITAQPNAESKALNNEQDDAAHQRQREADDLHAIPSILSAIEHQQALDEQRRAENEPKDWYQRLWQGLGNPVISNWALAIFAAVAAGIGVRTLRAIKFEVVTTTRAAKAAQTSAALAADTLATNREIERAYVTMSHVPPGIRFGQTPSGAVFVAVDIRIKNNGRTPARVTDFILNLLPVANKELPETPTYIRCPGPPDGAFLVTNDGFYRRARWGIGDLRGAQPEGEFRRAVAEERVTLCVFGYVDYVDQFHVRHRAGYGRKYNPRSDDRKTYASDSEFANRSNLVFIASDRYNYNIEIDEKGNPKG